MHSIKIATFCIALLFLGCGDDSKPSSMFSLKIENNTSEFHAGQSIGVTLEKKEDIPVDKVVYVIDGQELPSEGGKVSLDIVKLGNKELTAKVTHEGKTTEISRDIRVLAKTPPEIYTYEIINEFPHDIKSFTQGLEFHGDVLYEGTGHKGESYLRKINFTTGEVLQQIDLEEAYFGEGITILGNNIYQLTWKGKVGFIYDLATFTRKGSFQYGKSTEGWGLCNDGQKIYKSDGTEKIWLLNPDNLTEEGYIETVTDKSVFNKANELEYVDGKIYANVWQKESMMIIDAKSGAIEGVVNFGGLKSRVKKHDKLDVLNGIAYHPERETFFVTGKNWDKLFEIRIMKKD